MNQLFAVFLCLFLSGISSFAQENNPRINSGELIKKGTLLREEGKYQEALKVFTLINKSDTNYVSSLYEKAITCNADSQFLQGMRYCEEALHLDTERELEPDLYSEYGILLDNAGDQDRALRIFDSALVVYPAYTKLYFNKGTTLLRKDLYAEAEKVFQKAVLINPYTSGNHFKLAVSAIQQGKIVPAFLALMNYLLLTPEGPYAKNSINLLSAISKSEDDILEWIAGRKETPSENFMMVEQIVLSKIALDPKYKTIIKLDDAISRQYQVLLEKLEFDPEDKDFYMQYYVPIYKKIFNEKRLEILVNYSFSSANLPAITSYLKKNKKEMQALVDMAVGYFNTIRFTRELIVANRKTTGELYGISNGVIFGKGISSGKDEIQTGNWEYYYPAGNIKAIGNFNSKGEKEGIWKYYYFNGKLKGQENYINGKEEGEDVFYYDNGNISFKGIYKNGELQGKYTNYYRLGGISSIAEYQNGKLHGLRKSYYSSGVPLEVENYSEGKLDGGFKTYYNTGSLKKEGQYTKGIVNGPFKSYHENGVLSIEGQYENGLMSGNWKRYFESGKISSVENYLNGMLEGEFEDHYENGQLFTKYLSSKGKTTGEVNYFDSDGKKYSTLVFEKDQLKTGFYFDKTGKQIGYNEVRGKSSEYTRYNKYGFKNASGIYNDKAEQEGVWSYFYNSGNLNKTDTYVKGVANGPTISYFSNKSKKNEINFKDDEMNGYYTSYYIHGGKQQEGWYEVGQAQGTWITYNVFGNHTTIAEYIDDDLHGYKKSYWPNGKLSTEAQYFYGSLLNVTEYDTLGKVLNKTKLVNGSGDYELVHFNGKPVMKGSFLNGNLNGAFNHYYFDGSIETISFYKGDLRDSIYKHYLYGGILDTEGIYKLGNKVGTWKYYNSAGKPYYTEEYKDGKLNGNTTYYYANGTKEVEIPYKNGEREGIYKKYDKEGTLRFQMIFHQDQRVSYSYLDKNNKLVPEIPLPGGNGKVIAYYPNGNKSVEMEYIDGEKHGADNLYFANGKPELISTEFYGNSEGPLKRYYENGTVKTEYKYKHDELIDAFREFNNKGIVVYEGKYEMGVLHGPIKYYDDNGKLKETRIYYYGHILDIKK